MADLGTKTFSVRLPTVVAEEHCRESALARGWNRNKFIAVAVGEKLLREGRINRDQFVAYFQTPVEVDCG